MKNKNKTHVGGIVFNFKNLIMILVLCLCIFGLIAERTRFVLSGETGFMDSASPFMDSLVDLYFMVGYILIIVLVGVLYILIRILYLFSGDVSVINFISNSKIIMRVFSYVLEIFFLFYYFIDKILFINFVKNFFMKVSGINILNMFYGKKKFEFLTIQNISEYKRLELTGCAVPSLALISIGNPTFGLIFALDPAIDPAITLKVIGHQGYGTYEYDVTLRVPYNSEEYKFSDRARYIARGMDEYYPNGSFYYKGKSFNELVKMYVDLEVMGGQRPSGDIMDKFIGDMAKYKPVVHYFLTFDSVHVNTVDLLKGNRRLGETTDHVVLPYSVPIKVLVTSSDVLHSGAVPSLGIKVDAVPGRINQFIFEIKRNGYFYGQCSELCGNMHGYMPICVHAVHLDDFKEWLKNNAEII